MTGPIDGIDFKDSSEKNDAIKIIASDINAQCDNSDDSVDNDVIVQ